MMIFFVLLTLGFVFELGKNALTIESRQTSFKGADLSDPHAFLTKSLQSNFTGLILKKFISGLFNMLKKCILSNLFHFFYIKLTDNKHILKYRDYLLLIIYFYVIVKNKFTLCIHRWFSINHPNITSNFSRLYCVYCNICVGKGHMYSWYFVLVGVFLQNSNIIYSTFIIALCPLIHDYSIKHIYPYWPKLAKGIEILVNVVYLAAISICIEEIYRGILNPILTYIVSSLKNIWNGMLNSSGYGQKPVNLGGSSEPSNNNPNPGSGDGITPGFSSDNSDKKKQVSPEFAAYRENYDGFIKACKKTLKYNNGTNLKYNLPTIDKNYRDYLPSDDKQKLTELINKRHVRIAFNDSTTVKEFLLGKKEVITEVKNISIQIRDIYNRNSKNIKEEYLGGKNSIASKKFSQELETYSNECLKEYNAWKSVWSSQLPKSDEFEKQLRKANFSVYKIITSNPDNL
jgi:hypothetical protein